MVDAGIGRPEHDLPGDRVDQSPVLVVGLVRQYVCDLIQVEPAQIQHRATRKWIDRPSGSTQIHG